MSYNRGRPDARPGCHAGLSPVRTIPTTVALLIVSKAFMTIAWCDRLAHGGQPRVLAVGPTNFGEGPGNRT